MIEIEAESVGLLLSCPITREPSGRDFLLARIPTAIGDGLNRSRDNRHIDIGLIINQLAAVGRLKGDVWPILIVLDTALQTVRGAELETRITELMRRLEQRYGREEHAPPPSGGSVPSEPELLLFGVDRRVSFDFIEGARRAARGIARICIGNAYGTAWLIARELLITNCHVIDGLEGHTPKELTARCRDAVGWFDYHAEGGGHVEVAGAELVHFSRTLDYALLRLSNADVAAREPIPIRRTPSDLARGARLNIAQHPRGGPLRFAIRSNFLVENAPTAIRYVTDTEQGSSGSPVCDDNWQAVALHARSCAVPEQQVPGGITRHLNEGILISAIVLDPTLPAGLL